MEESEIYQVNQGVQGFAMHAFLYCDEGTMMSTAKESYEDPQCIDQYTV